MLLPALSSIWRCQLWKEPPRPQYGAVSSTALLLPFLGAVKPSPPRNAPGADAYSLLSYAVTSGTLRLDFEVLPLRPSDVGDGALSSWMSRACRAGRRGVDAHGINSRRRIIPWCGESVWKSGRQWSRRDAHKTSELGGSSGEPTQPSFPAQCPPVTPIPRPEPPRLRAHTAHFGRPKFRTLHRSVVDAGGARSWRQKLPFRRPIVGALKQRRRLSRVNPCLASCDVHLVAGSAGVCDSSVLLHGIIAVDRAGWYRLGTGMRCLGVTWTKD